MNLARRKGCQKKVKETPTPSCLLRIKKDIAEIFNEPSAGVFILPDETDITVIHALIVGPDDTPYEGGFFYLLLRCPSDYPYRPPRVRLMTTDEGKVRFNPNLYADGKVCLSILGTWTGPRWSPAQSLQSVLISIQSLMNEKPFHNEPGFESNSWWMRGRSDRYNEITSHETLRVAVCGMLEGVTADSTNCPRSLVEIMETTFLGRYGRYESTAKAGLNLDTKYMKDPFGFLFWPIRGIFNHSSILKRLEKIKAKLEEEKPQESES